MRADRVVSMMLLLHRRGRMSARELAEELEVSVRTVMRDIDALGVAGVPVFSHRGPDGGFEIWPGFDPGLRALGSEEAAALALLGMPAVAALLGLGDAHRSVRLKLIDGLPPDLANEMELMASRFHHDPTPARGEPPTRALAFLSTAVRRRREIRARIGGGEPEVLEPLGLVLRAGDWFLVAHRDGVPDAIPVDALERYETTGRRFPYPEDWGLAAFWRESRPA